MAWRICRKAGQGTAISGLVRLAQQRFGWPSVVVSVVAAHARFSLPRDRLAWRRGAAIAGVSRPVRGLGGRSGPARSALLRGSVPPGCFPDPLSPRSSDESYEFEIAGRTLS